MTRAFSVAKLTAPTDDFQRAAAAAVGTVGKAVWIGMAPAEQTRAIYDQLRQIDAMRAKAIAFQPGPRGRFRLAGDPIPKRSAA